MCIFKNEQDRLLAGKPLELIEQRSKCSATLLRRTQRQRRVPIVKWDRKQRCKKRRYGSNSRCAYGEQRLNLSEPLLGRVVCLKTSCPLQLFNEGTKCAVGVIRRALIAQTPMRIAGNSLPDGRRKAGLADPRLAREQ